MPDSDGAGFCTYVCCNRAGWVNCRELLLVGVVSDLRIVWVSTCLFGIM